MAENTYVTISGFIQFDPNEREANGKNVIEVFVKTTGGEGKNVRCTLWPEIKIPKGDAPKKGDFVAVEGKYSTSTYQGEDGSSKTSYQISATSYAKLGEAYPREDREVVPARAKVEKVPF